MVHPRMDSVPIYGHDSLAEGSSSIFSTSAFERSWILPLSCPMPLNYFLSQRRPLSPSDGSDKQRIYTSMLDHLSKPKIG